MSYQRERDTFIATVTKEGLPLWIAERLLREATGFQRRAELACSSEAADRDRVPCPRATAERKYATKKIAIATAAFARYSCLCDMYNGSHETIPRITLQDWHAERRCEKLLADENQKLKLAAFGAVMGLENLKPLPRWTLLTAGDPRGYTLRIIPPSYAAENATRSKDDPRAIGVPARDSRLRF